MISLKMSILKESLSKNNTESHINIDIFLFLIEIYYDSYLKAVLQSEDKSINNKRSFIFLHFRK